MKTDRIRLLSVWKGKKIWFDSKERSILSNFLLSWLHHHQVSAMIVQYLSFVPNPLFPRECRNTIFFGNEHIQYKMLYGLILIIWRHKSYNILISYNWISVMLFKGIHESYCAKKRLKKKGTAILQIVDILKK